VIAWSLVAISILWGLAAFLVFRRITDHVALRKVRKRLYAHLLGIRLYSEEPALVFRAQKELIVDNLRFLALVAKPVLIMGLPFALLYGQLESFYGWSPLEVGHSAVVTLSGDGQYTLLAPSGIVVETPPVNVSSEHQISWRIRALAPVRGNLRFIRSGSGDLLSPIAAGEWSPFCCRPRESSVEVDYPKAEVTIAGLELPWLAWFLIISTASAVLAGFTLSFAPALHPATRLRNRTT
jgi:hypothetical protein